MTKPNTRRAFFALAATVALSISGMAAAQPYPARTVKLIVPYPPGGPVDAFARGFAEKLGTLWGQAVLIDNRPGANEIIAADAAAKAAPDGYTLLLAADPALSQNQFLFAKLPYDPEKDLIPVSRVVDVNMALIVKGDVPANNLKDFVALMKKDGAKRNFGSAGNGNVTQLAFEALKREAGFEMTHVPYKGIAPAISDMLGGSIDAMFAGSTAAIPHLKSGKMKVLAISGAKRARALPDVPTLAEAGYPKLEARFYLGLSAPKGVPDAITHKIASDVRRAMTDKVFLEKFVDFNGFDPAGTTPEEFAKFLKTDREVSGQRIRAAGVKLD
jgi:tripartite-type tricarboxylate transporter receptor subunit TctC